MASHLLHEAPENPFRDASAVEVTTPIFYVNAQPHIGHLFSSMVADVLARFHRAEGKQVLYMTGTDEHGQKIQKAAEAKGIPTQQFCDEVSQLFKDLMDKANISYDDWIRTTQPRHSAAVLEMWRRCDAAGYIYKDEHSGWYCVSDETFVVENETVVEERDGKQVRLSAESRQPVEWVKEENYKFRLSAFEEPLLEWLNTEPYPVRPEYRRQEVIAFIENGLKDLSISRPKHRIQWGLPCPDEDHTIYVWLDALTNYLTVAGFPDESKALEWWPNVHHIIGKDIIRFHCVYWPAFLHAAGVPKPKRLTVHGHWMSEGMKMSKSLGNVVDPHEMIGEFGLEVFRYFLIREGDINRDADFTVSRLKAVFEADLANNLGNLFARALTLAKDSPTMEVPETFAAEDQELLDDLKKTIPNVCKWFANVEFSQGLELLFVKVVAAANKYFSDTAPWKLKKEGEEGKARAKTIVFTVLHCLRATAVLLQAVLPEAAAKMLDHLKVPADKRSLAQVPLDPAPVEILVSAHAVCLVRCSC